MIRDLLQTAEDAHVEADVVVVGAGIAGLIMADRLRKDGLKVAILESGSERQVDERHELNRVEIAGDPYAGAEDGRFRCLGGTSTRWGGAMLPFLPVDMQSHSAGWDARWPVEFEEVQPYQDELNALFALPSGPFDRPDLYPASEGGVRFLPRLAAWPAFGRRNVATLLRDRLTKDQGLEVWLNAHVTGSTLSPAGRVERIVATAPDGRKLTARAAHFVVAAGAIESTRLLLLLDRANDERLFAPAAVLGRYFHDHLSAHSASLEVRDRKLLGDLAGFRFETNGMRNLRFEPAEETRIQRRLPGGFTHIVFASLERDGFEALRDIYRGLQRRRLPSGGDVGLLARNLPWFARAAWKRFVGRQLLLPDRADFKLNVIVEQHPHRDNRITLSSERIDRHGLPLARIEWQVRADDIDNHRRMFALFGEYWQKAHLTRAAALEARDPELVAEELRTGGGTYHPGGTTRMSASPGEGVVDPMLRAHAVPNLSVVSTSAFPTGGAANPTYMLMLFALRSAAALAADLGRGTR